MPVFLQQLVSELFGLIQGGGSSAVKFRLEKIGGRIMFGLWKIKSRMCLCNQGYTTSVWRGGGKNTQHQPEEAVAIILTSWHVKRFCQSGAV